MSQEVDRTENGAISLRQSIHTYLSRLSGPERDAVAVILDRFARWYGPTRPLSGITPAEVEAYQSMLMDSRQNRPERIEPLRAFFSHASKKKLTGTNLATALNARRRVRSGGKSAATRPAVPTVELTEAGRDQLAAELERLETVERPLVTQEMARAREDGDMRENAPYHAAKETLGRIQGRINEIKGLLSAAQIVARSSNGGRVGLGSTVVVWDEQEQERVTYTLVGPGEIDRRERKISIQSPIGRALSDHLVGDEVDVDTPAGRHRYRIERIEARG